MNIKNIFPGLSSQLATEIIENSSLVEIPEKIEVMREGQYIKSVPIVISGLVKAFTSPIIAKSDITNNLTLL